jgi:tripartite-type tricarboxylate transporter receptor subunit TctC
MPARIRSRLCLGAFALTTFAAALPAAQAAEPAYPTRPVRMLVGFPPGGSTDALARILAPRLAESMGQGWVVDNRGGAGGNLATEMVARGAPDGHTVLLALNTQLTASQSLYKLPFNVEKDLYPVTNLATHEHIVLVLPSVAAKTFKEFVALAKAKPGAFNYGSSGIGGSLHLAAELLKRRAGFDMVHVAYKGAGPAIAAFLASEVQVMVGAVPSTIAHVRSGRVRALATTGPTRHKVTQDLPTVAESGYPGFENVAWFAFLVPSGTPRHVTDRIFADTHKALGMPEVQATMGKLGLDPQPSTQAEVAERLRSETRMLAEVIKEAGIKGE